MIILSWDVGVINLAYCIIDYIDIDNYKILHWDKINLIENLQKKCDYDDCNLNSITNINGNYYCQNHKEFANENIDFSHIIKQFEMFDNEGKCANEKCNKKICYKSKKDELYYCKNHHISLINKLKKEHLKKISKKVKSKVNSFNQNDIYMSLIKHLDNCNFMFNVDEVIIENQPVLKNPKMKAVASTLYTYFLIRGMVEKKQIKDVKYVCASNKLLLKQDKDNTEKVLSSTKSKAQKYQQTKKLAIIYCKKQLELYCQEYLDFLEKTDKKDDLCDSFLQGLAYLQKNNKKKI